MSDLKLWEQKTKRRHWAFSKGMRDAINGEPYIPCLHMESESWAQGYAWAIEAGYA